MTWDLGVLSVRHLVIKKKKIPADDIMRLDLGEDMVAVKSYYESFTSIQPSHLIPSIYFTVYSTQYSYNICSFSLTLNWQLKIETGYV